MYPYITLEGMNIPSYSLCIIIGVIVSFGISWHFIKTTSIPKQELLYLYGMAILGAVLGSKILSILLDIPYLIENYTIFLENPSFILTYLQAGFVFYGGLIGAILMVYGYASYFHLPKKEVFTLFALSLPLAHAIGRIGCFLAGCCYGMPCDTLGIAYTHSTIAPNGIKLFPIQLVEAIENVILFFYLCKKYDQNKSYPLLLTYLKRYAVIRFVNEFLRYDAYRGIVFLSTSQWISFILFCICLFIERKKQKETSL